MLAFIPRSNLYKKNFEIFFEMYPDGFIVSLTREPLSWLSSAIKHSLEYQDVNYALKQKIKAAFSEEMKKVIFS